MKDEMQIYKKERKEGACIKFFRVLSLLLAFSVFSFVFSLFLTNFVSAEVNYCCEKTLTGAWCQNAPQEQCDSNFKMAPTSCESTSYCKPGCCFDSIEGLCMESTPQRVCSANGGTWSNDSKCNIPQCTLGCCILADQGAFVTLTRCKQLAGFYGLIADFRRNIANEVECIATAQGADKGACVTYDENLGKNTCKFTTREQCKKPMILEGASVNETLAFANSSKPAPSGFYKGILCSAEELGTECGPSTKTTIIEGKDEVYFTDTCGNIANIYDASRYNDKEYWKKVFKKSESCGYGSSNAGSKTCGNCDYYLGSIAKKATRATGTPTYGNYICVDLSCKKEGKRHGESWCVYDTPSGDSKDPVGSRYFKAVCLNNEVIVEPCADFRNEICIEEKFGGFSEAACRVNRWQDCMQQEEKADCENKDVRDCKWIEGYYFSTQSGQIEKSINETEAKKRGVQQTPTGLCVPYYPPGFVFWGSQGGAAGQTGVQKAPGTFNATTPAFKAQTPVFGTGYVNPSTSSDVASATSQCSSGNAKLTVKFKKTKYPLKIFGTRETAWHCDESFGNCQYLTEEDERNANISVESAKKWAEDMNEICYSLGDCGGYINWLGVRTEDGYAAYQNGKRILGAGGAEILEKEKKTTQQSTAQSQGATSGVTGKFIVDLIKKLGGN